MKSLLITILVMFMAAVALEADAAVVYLKNGKVMTGKIVEKTPEYLVLKTG